MNPGDFSKSLRVIASRLDNSGVPSKKLVVDDLKRLFNKLATRSDIINEIEQKFNYVGVYPPNMREVSPGVFEGEIDTGWVLTVVDSPREVKLNGRMMKSIDDAVNSYQNNESYDETQNRNHRIVELFDGYRTIIKSDLTKEEAQEIMLNDKTGLYHEVKVHNIWVLIQNCTCGSGYPSPSYEDGCTLGTPDCG